MTLLTAALIVPRAVTARGMLYAALWQLAAAAAVATLLLCAAASQYKLARPATARQWMRLCVSGPT